MRQNYHKCINILSLLFCVIFSQYSTANVVCDNVATPGSGFPELGTAFAGCSGTSIVTSQNNGAALAQGYNYTFETIGTDVKITFTLLDNKVGLVAHLWRETPFLEIGQMTNITGQTFTRTITNQTPGQTISYAVKFSYAAGGVIVTQYISYVVGDNCTSGPADTEAPTDFTATAGTVTSSSVQLLLNATDDSGALTYTITYGSTTTTATGVSGVQKSVIINNLTHSTAYTFSISAKDAANNVAANNPIVVGATTLVDTSNACSGTSSQAQESSFSTGYDYSFVTNGTSVTATFKLLDTDKTGVVAYLWRQPPGGGFYETNMTASAGLTFSTTVAGLTPNTTHNFAVKFAHSTGLVVTKYFAYTVGDSCGAAPPDTQAPTGFTATAGTISSNSVQLLLNGSDNSGAVIYTISYGATTTTVTGNSGAQQSKLIINLTPETAYNFSITAKDAAGNLAANNPIVVGVTTLVDTNTTCAGNSAQAADGSFTTGYTYSFQTTDNSVTATFTLLDTDKTGVVAYLWRETPFAEWPMTPSAGLTFTRTITGLTPGAIVKLGVKFDHAGGISRTKYFTYTVGDNCGVGEDTEVPTAFTASLGTITSTSVELLLNATDDSGEVTYDVTYGSTTTSATGESGVQKSVIINNLAPETDYTFSIAASDESGNEAVNNAILLNATTQDHLNTQCSGFSSEAVQNSFSTGYSYNFVTNGTDVTVTFTMLDTDKTGVIAYLWQQTPFSESLMTNTSGLTFSQTLTGQVPGTTVNCAVKFAYAGGLVVTNYFSYLVGNDNCAGTPLDFTTIWNGNAWSNGIPVSDDYSAVIEGNYNSGVNGEITANRLVVNSGNVVISSGNNLYITGIVTVHDEASLTLEHNANLIQVDDVENIGVISVIKESTPMYRLDYAMWASPVQEQKLKAFSPETLDNRFYRYNPLSDAYAPIASPATTDFGIGAGYLIRVSNIHPAFVDMATPATSWVGSFTGVPNNGTINVPVIPLEDNEGTDEDVSGFNSIGNPYPSPINIAAFYAANAGNLGSNTSLYFWRKKNGAAYSSYASLTLAGYIANGQIFEDEDGNEVNYGDAGAGLFSNPNQSGDWVINPGQGFIVQASTNSIVFNNEMRVAITNGQMFRTGQDEEPSASRLWLNVKGLDGELSQTMVGYMDNATLGIDYGYDGKALTDGNIAIYSLAGESKLGIQARPAFHAADVVPLGYKAETAGSYTISLDHFDGIFAADQNIYLRDNFLGGSTHDLKAGPYEFATEEGTITTRFDVVYAEALATETPLFESSSIMVYKQGNAISISTGGTDIRSIAVYDIQGRLLHQADNINSPATSVTTLQANKQVLIVEVTSADSNKASKMIVY